MTAERSVVMFLCTLLTTVIVLVHARDATTTLEYDDPVPANETTARHRVDTDSPAAEGRQGAVSLQTEPASSKAKREQTLHSILAARRRQMFGQRPLEVRAPNRTPRPVEPGLKDSSDLLEAQETRHGMYVTMSGGEKEEPPLSENEGPTTGPTVELVTKDAERQTTTESVAASTSTSTIQKNATTTIGPPSGPAAKEPESRKKNIVSMPESLYNYFRPVESNIPVEDMSQFLYFGQKIQPEPRNGTANDTLSPTTATSSRRRYSMKRLGLTTPLPQLEETNDEMNVAVERQSAQSPKVAKLKGPYRGPDGGPFYRKGRPTDPTIASNVIATADVAVVGNGTGQAGDPSAHAAQAQLRRERGSAAAHVAAETRNAAGGPGSAATQIPGRQPVSADADKPAGESEIGFRAPAGPSANGVDAAAENSSTDGTRSEEAPEMYGDHTEQIRRFDVYERGEGGPEQPRSRESNNIETSTSRDKAGRPPTTEPFRVEWTSPGTSTLRIIVTDVGPGDRYTVKPVESAAKRVRGGPHGDGAAASGAAEPQSDAAAEGTTTATRPRHREPKQRTGKEQGGAGDREQRRHQEQQQQHVYAYTITNVTRLLRNYTGPGLSREEHGGAGGAAEITTGSALRRQPPAQPPLPPPPPPSPPVLPRAGSGIEAGRAPAELSAGRTVEAVAAGRVTAGVSLVGERQRKAGAVAADGAPAQHHQHQLTVNKSGLRPSRPTEAAGRGAVRWNHTRTRSADLEGFGDRRFLRKSASAVLNQRIGGGQEEEVGSAKRRRLANGQPAASGRRLKAAKGPEDPRTWRGPVNGSVSTSPKDPGDEAAVSSTIGNRTPADSIAMEQRTQPSVEATEPTTTQQPVVDADNFTGPAEPDARARLNLSPSEKESVPASGASAPGSGSGLPTVTVTAAAAGETAEPPKGTAAGSPVPVFPVTPRIIAETAENETFTLPATGSVAGRDANQLTDGGAHGPGSFEVANMDPSEIQKMYRSKNVSEATTPATTVQIEVSTTPFEESTVGPDSRKRLAGERSPEVRGRNLSDKSRDKDDVLPIMQLYNDSDILNGSGPMHTFGPDRRAELPTQKPRVPVTTEEANETTAKTVTNETTAGPTRGPVTETTRKDRHEDNRESSGGHVPPTGPGRGSNRTRHRPVYHHAILPEYNVSVYSDELNRTFFEAGLISVSPRESVNISEVISKRHDGDAIASQETVAVVSYILATLVVFPIAVGVGLILRRLILRNRKVLEESDTSSEISCRKDALNLENGDFKTSIEKAITKLPRIQHLCHEAEKPPPPSSQESRWEFPRDKLRLQTVLGQGNFGQVWKAEADDLTGHQGTTRLVAVKTVKEGASDREEEDLVRELEIMQQLGSHPNVVTLLGCCTEQEPHYLILEYVMYGKLLAYLRDHRTRQDFYNFSEDSAALTSRDLTVFGYCVARGMEYLASKKIIHRDLAARNVLVDHNKLCKIADFGMSRFANENGEVIETRHGRNALPIRWMAPESLIYSLFTTKTDVWSFGILMWEIVTLGSTPYPDMTAREVMRNVQNGYRLERPSHCRSELFRVISRCWHADPERRPEFQTLRRDLAQLLEDNLNGHYVDLESFASECTD